MPPTYDELLRENAFLRRRVEQLERQVVELERLVETLRKESKRQAAPFRRQEEPARPPKTPGRKAGKRHGPHAHRSPPPWPAAADRLDDGAECPAEAYTLCLYLIPRARRMHVTRQIDGVRVDTVHAMAWGLSCDPPTADLDKTVLATETLALWRGSIVVRGASTQHVF